MTSFGSNVGRAYVSIHADTRGMDMQVAAVLKQMNKKAEKFGGEAGEAWAKGFIERNGLGRGNSRIDKAAIEMYERQAKLADERGKQVGKRYGKWLADSFGQEVGGRMLAKLVADARESQGKLQNIWADSFNVISRTRAEVAKEIDDENKEEIRRAKATAEEITRIENEKNRVAERNAKEEERRNQVRIRDQNNLLREIQKAALGFDDIARGVDRAFGGSSRNPILRTMGALASFPFKVLSGAEKAIDGVANSIRLMAKSFELLGPMKTFGIMASKLVGSLAGFAASAAAVSWTLVGLVQIAGPAAAALSLLAGGFTALLASVSIGAIGGLVALGPAVFALGGAFTVLLSSFALWKKTATDAEKNAVAPLLDRFHEMRNEMRMGLFGDVANQAQQLEKVVGTKGEGLRGALEETSKAISRVATNWFTTVADVTQGPGKNMQKMFESMAPLTEKWGAATANATNGLFGMLAAALPIANKLADKVVEMTAKFSDFANSTEGNAKLADFFERAWGSAVKLGTILVEIVKIIGLVFDMGQKTGDGFLDGIISALKRMEAWLRSNTDAVQKWFDDSKRFISGVGDVFKAVGRIFDTLDTGESRGQITDLTEVLVVFLDSVNNGIKKVQGMDFGRISDAFHNLSAAVKSEILPQFQELFDLFTSGDAITTISVGIELLATLMGPLGLGLQIVTDVLQIMVGIWKSLPDPIQEFLAVMLLVQKLKIIGAITGIMTALGGLVGSLGTAAGAAGGFKTALLNSLKSGAYVAAAAGLVIIGKMIWDQWHQDEEQAKKLKDATSDMFNSMKAAGGPTTAFLQEWSDQFASAGKNAEFFGFKVDDMVSAAQKGPEALEGMRQSMLDNAEAAGLSGIAFDVVKKGIDNVVVPLRDAETKWRDLIKAHQDFAAATDPVDRQISDLTEGIAKFSDTTEDADSRARGLTQALDALAGGNKMTVAQSLSAAADASRDLTKAFAGTSEEGVHVIDAFDATTGAVNATSPAFSTLNKEMVDQKGAFSKVVTAAYDAAGGYANLDVSSAAATAAAQKYTADLSTQLQAMGLSEQQAADLIAQYNLVPGDVSTAVSAKGVDKAVEDMNLAKTKAEELDKLNPTIKVFGDISAWERSLANAKAAMATLTVAGDAKGVRTDMFLGAAPQMAGGIVDKPGLYLRGERNYREAVVPLDLPLGRVNKDVRPYAAMLRGDPYASQYVGNTAPQRVYNNTVTVEAKSADADAVARSVMNRLATLGR